MDDMSLDDARALLEASRMGILSFAHDDDAYSIPLFYGVDGDSVYVHCHPGMKDEYVASTRHACLVVVHMESENIWESVQAFGPVEKLSLSSDIDAAKAALFNVPFPPAEGHFQSGRPARPEQNIFYARLKIERLAGKSSEFKE